MNIEDLTEDFDILIIAWLKSGDENATNLAYSLAKYVKSKQLPIHDVVSSLPTSKDRISQLKKAIEMWDLKNDINDKQAFSCGWNNCYRWIKDFVRQQR